VRHLLNHNVVVWRTTRPDPRQSDCSSDRDVPRSARPARQRSYFPPPGPVSLHQFRIRPARPHRRSALLPVSIVSAFLRSFAIVAPRDHDRSVAHVEGFDTCRNRAYGTRRRELRGFVTATAQSVTSALSADGGISRTRLAVRGPGAVARRLVDSIHACALAPPTPPTLPACAETHYVFGWSCTPTGTKGAAAAQTWRRAVFSQCYPAVPKPPLSP